MAMTAASSALLCKPSSSVANMDELHSSGPPYCSASRGRAFDMIVDSIRGNAVG